MMRAIGEAPFATFFQLRVAMPNFLVYQCIRNEKAPDANPPPDSVKDRLRRGHCLEPLGLGPRQSQGEQGPDTAASRRTRRGHQSILASGREGEANSLTWLGNSYGYRCGFVENTSRSGHQREPPQSIYQQGLRRNRIGNIRGLGIHRVGCPNSADTPDAGEF
jgi:hypothetical protein